MCASTAPAAVPDGVVDLGSSTAISENDQPVFRDLPNIVGLDSLEAFAAAPERADIAAVQAHYGDVTANIEAACEAIEDMMAELPR